MFAFSVFSSSEQITLSGKQETLQNQMLPKDDVCSLDFLFRLYLLPGIIFLSSVCLAGHNDLGTRRYFGVKKVLAKTQRVVKLC